MVDREVFTAKVSPKYKGKQKTLGEVLIDEKDVPKEFYIPKDQLAQWKYLKGAKREERQSSSGHKYFYTEGSMVFPEPLDKPSRT